MTEEEAKKLYSQVPTYIKSFISLVENYYAPYTNNIVRCFIAMDLRGFTEDQLRELFDIIRREYSNTYKTPPDTNRLMKAWEKKVEQSGLKLVNNHYEDRNGNVFDSNMQKIGHYDGGNGRFVPFVNNKKVKELVLLEGAAAITPEQYLKCIDNEDIKEIAIRGEE